MTCSFLLIMPFAVGFIAAYLAARAGRRGLSVWLTLPVLTTLALLLSAFLLFWEGAICLFLLTPVALFMAICGGVIGNVCAHRFGKGTVACIAALPFLCSPVEQWIGPQVELHQVATQIEINAPPSVIWSEIERVKPIHPAEQQFSWTQTIGFPRPIEATLTGEGPGAIRHATFSGGVLFVETVTHWEPGRRLAFTIRADSANIPPHTLDEHVTIGGEYFDALYGEYRLEPLANGRTMLHLISRHRLSTTLNFYARFWTVAVMRDIQDNILFVIRNRCEATRR